MTTNITEKHQRDFNALVSGEYDNFALFSCFIDGKPGAAVVVLAQEPDDNWIVQPLFVSVTDAMIITDHDGRETYPLTPDPENPGKLKEA